MTLVIDASVTLAWVFVDEWTELTNELLGQLRQRGAVVPVIWPFEITNALITAERRGRIAPADVERFVELIVGLPITLDEGAIALAFGPVLTLARQLGLSAYDASYLELAQRTRLPLATLDRRLAAAASQLGIPLATDE